MIPLLFLIIIPFSAVFVYYLTLLFFLLILNTSSGIVLAVVFYVTFLKLTLINRSETYFYSSKKSVFFINCQNINFIRTYSRKWLIIIEIIT